MSKSSKAQSGKAAHPVVGAKFASGAALVFRGFGKHDGAWYYVEKWPPLPGQENEREAAMWIPDEVAELVNRAAEVKP